VSAASLWMQEGLRHYEAGRLAQAAAAFERVLAADPRAHDALRLLGAIALRSGQADRAVALFQRATAVDPGNPVHASNLGNALAAVGRHDDALHAYATALALNPGFAEAHYNRGRVYQEQGRLADAVASYSKAIEIRPDLYVAHQNRIMLANYLDTVEAATVRAWYEAFARQFEAPLKIPGRHAGRPEERARRLRVGYVSGDFRAHPVADFMLPVIARHDRPNFEVWCYHTGPGSDRMTDEIRTAADRFMPCPGVTDELLAARVRTDRIDILVDLSGHSAGNRLRTFMRRPAPVQVAYLGYPATTGLAGIQYRITDGLADPLDEPSEWYSERLVRLPRSFLCYGGARFERPPEAAPRHRKGYVTFGSFNNLAKVTSAVVGAWARVLDAVPDSRLMLKSSLGHGAASHQRLLDEFARSGVHGDRLTLLPREPSREPHLARYDDVDIALDTFPYNGTTTTCEALWMGVPVITLSGRRHAGRVGRTLLGNVGLADAVCGTVDEYVSTAARWADDGARLDALRTRLRGMLAASPVMDAAGFVRELEVAYRGIWEIWCGGAGT
jgi:protein O-GlcNAc transferase